LEDLYDDNELMSSLDETPLSDVGGLLRRPSAKNDRDFVDCEPIFANGPELMELDAPIVTLPITTAPAVLGLNWGMGLPSGP